MTNKEPLIIGIDPGTTSAIAGINFESELIFLESGKNLSIDLMIEEALSSGRPVVVSSDKSSTPSKVDKFASNLGIKIYRPDEDLSQTKKFRIGQGESSHEIDAVASARNALNNMERKVEKIERNSEENDLSLVKSAEEMLLDRNYESGKNQDEPEIVEEDKETKTSLESRLKRKIGRLQQKIEDLEEENRSLKEENRKLRTESRKSEVDLEELTDREIMKREGIIKDKNSEISQLKKKIDNREKIIRSYQEALKRINEGEKLVEVEEFDSDSADNFIELEEFVVSPESSEDMKDVIEDYRSSRN
jgi:predicted RNase H-like nuclease (RuvC/YqgF family)